MTDKLQEKLKDMLIEDIDHRVYVNKNKNYLSIKYDKEENSFKVSTFDGNKYMIYEDLSFDDVVILIKTNDFISECVELCERRLMKEKRYNEALKSMIDELNELDICEELKEKMEEIIKRVSNLPEKVGTFNRVFLRALEPGTSIHLRLTDSSCVESENYPLHLQVIMEEECNHGLMCYVYPKYNLSQIAELIGEYEPDLEDEKSYVKRKVID